MIYWLQRVGALLAAQLLPFAHMITITYFGSLKLLQPSGSEQLEWSGGTTDDLLSTLRGRGPDWDEALSPGRVFKLALNQQLLHGPAPLSAGDEVAILPPVTGG